MADEGVDEDKRATLRRFAALGAASPLARFSGDGDSDARDAIAGYLTTTPGAHFSKVRDDLQLGTGETQYHLRKLLEGGAIEAREDGEYRRFFPADEFTDREQVALGYLRRRTHRGVLVGLLRDPTRSPSDLAAHLDVSVPTVSSAATDLEAAGLLDRSDGYDVTEPETVLALTVRYADSFDAAAAALAREADDLVTYDG